MTESSAEENILPEEISKIPFSDLQKLTKECGSKVLSDFVTSKKNSPKKCEFHRENKNRPREMSSKIPLFKDPVKSSKKITKPKASVDPRFHHSHGTFDQKKFEDNYKFLNNIKKKERRILTKKLKNPEIDDEEREKINKLIQRMSNQRREEVRKKYESKLKNEEREYEIKQLEQGRKPDYCKKSEEKVLSLIRDFEARKEKGGLQKHIKRRRKKSLRKDKQKLSMLNSIQ
ncbi:hypothetical protein V9T40_002879 [Parthenolecanium corni]|uniref:rRNA biogenesis protein RRP36 n=1 Tax=Parthenolecanium corni TaxID=536013 RepID=A0AAN9TJB1_9HEMI